MNPRRMASSQGRRLADSPVAHVLLLAALVALTFFAFLGRRPLWDMDEAMHAVIARDMLRQGDWVTPRFGGEPFFDKPILHFWLVALSFRALGVTEFAARLPGAAMGTGLVLVAYFLGRRLAGSRVGLMGAVILATSLEVAVVSRSVVHDSSLAFFTTLALYLAYRAMEGEGRRLYLWASVAVGFAVLAKGPVGALLPALVVGILAAMRRQLGRLLKEAPVVPCLLTIVAVAGPWYIMAEQRNPGYLKWFLLEHNVGRFTSDTARHTEPIWYYLPVAFAGFIPWSCFLPTTLWPDATSTPPEAGRRVARRFLGIWVWAVLGFFTLAHAKLPTYILPVFPPMAIAVAMEWSAAAGERDARRRRRFMIAAAAWIAALALGLAGVAASGSSLRMEAGLSVGDVALPLAVLLAAAATSLALFAGRRPAASFVAASGGAVAALLVAASVALPHMDAYRSSRELGRHLDGILPAGQPVVYFRRVRESIAFYTDRPSLVIDDAESLRLHLQANPAALAVVEQKYIDDLGASFEIESAFGSKVAIRARPAPSSGQPAETLPPLRE